MKTEIEIEKPVLVEKAKIPNVANAFVRFKNFTTEREVAEKAFIMVLSSQGKLVPYDAVEILRTQRKILGQSNFSVQPTLDILHTMIDEYNYATLQ